MNATLGFVGIGLFAAILVSRLFWNGTKALTRCGPYPLTCQRMTVSLVSEGKLLPGGEAADQGANISCTPAMMEKSQLCRDECAAGVPSQPVGKREVCVPEGLNEGSQA
jgi:hypothetical protein